MSKAIFLLFVILLISCCVETGMVTTTNLSIDETPKSNENQTNETELIIVTNKITEVIDETNKTPQTVVNETIKKLVVNLSIIVNPSEEWVKIKSNGDAVDLDKWILMDIALHKYQFSKFILNPNMTVRIHSGEGNNNSTDLYWGYKISIWNDDGDTATLIDKNGNLIAEYRYSKSSTQSTQGASQDLCINIVCNQNILQCPDGYNATCIPLCVDGSCGSCTPDCTGHADLCAGVTCYNSTIMCFDGYNVSCQNTCMAGICSNCTPDCTGHENPCMNITCNNSTLICWDGYSASCTNNCTDGSCSNCTPNCTGHEIYHILILEVYYDTIGEDSDEEWFELYNPTTETIDLTGYNISDNQNTEALPNGTIILARDYLTIARNSTGFHNLYGCNPDIELGVGLLSNTGDQLTLSNSTSSVDFVAWENYVEGWGISAGQNKTIKRMNHDTDSANDWLSDQTPEPSC